MDFCTSHELWEPSITNCEFNKHDVGLVISEI